jgi:RNA polymerase-binding protein DksA
VFNSVPKMNAERVGIGSTRHWSPSLRMECEATLQQTRRAACARLDRVLGQLRAAEEEAGQGDEIDRATQMAEHYRLRAGVERERELIREVDHALDKLVSGGYGVCEATGEPIEAARLLARPWARHSRAHAEEVERKRGRLEPPRAA